MCAAGNGTLIVPGGWIVALPASKIMPGPCVGIQHIGAWLRFREGLGGKCAGP